MSTLGKILLKAFILLNLALPYALFGKVVIRGKIVGYDGRTVVYYHPTLEGIYAPYWKEVRPSPSGLFRIEYENEGYGNVRDSYKRMEYRFFHDENGEVFFELKDIADNLSRSTSFVVRDSLKQAHTVRISGDYEAINRFYNQNLRSTCYTTRLVEGTYFSRLIYKATTPEEALNLLAAQIDELLGDQ
jgi:hypothetical protein